MDGTKSLKFIIPVVIAFLLVIFGVFQIYKSKVANRTSDVSPVPIASPNTGFQTSPSPSVSPLVMGITPSQLPSAGSDTVEVKNVGIYVDTPTANQKVSSQLKVSGRANVFDGNVQIRVKDANGNVLGTGAATACLGTDACPFGALVFFPKPTTASGTIELYSPNAVDAAEDYLQTIPVQF